MKRITLPDIHACLRDMRNEIHVPEDVIVRARKALDRMLAVGRGEGVNAPDPVLIVGGGIAGLSAALGIAPTPVTVLSRAPKASKVRPARWHKVESPPR